MNTELIAYYAALLILQYKNKPKAKVTIEAMIRVLMIYDLIRSVQNGYDIETAIGHQQDIIGKYIGASRIINGVDFTRTYFGYILYADTPPVVGFSGYAEYTGGTPDVQYRSYSEEGGLILQLTDEEFRLLMRLKILKNYGNASLYQIDTLLGAYFTDASVTDNADMTIDYEFDADYSRLITIAASQGLIPQPTGVGVSISFV